MDDQLKIVINTGLNTKDTSQIEADLKIIEKALQDKQIKVNVGFDTSKIKQEAENASKQIDANIKTKTPNISVGVEVNQKKLDQAKSVLLKQMEILQAQANKANIDLNANGNQTKFNDLISTNNFENMKDAGYNLKMMRLEYQKLNAEMTKDIPQNALEGMNKKLLNMPSAITQIETKFAKLKQPTQEVSTQVANLNTLLNNANNINLSNDERIQTFNKLKDSIVLTKNEISALQSVENQVASKSKLNSSIEKLSIQAQIGRNRFQTLTNQLKPIAKKEYSDRINDISNSFKNVSNSADLSKATGEMNKFRTEMISTGNVGKTMWTKLGENVKNFVGFLGSATLVMTVVNGIKGVVSNVSTLDKSLTDLRLATNGTAEETTKLLSAYNKMAVSMGATTKEIADSADSFLRQGKSITDTNTLIKDSMMLSKLGQIESADATTYLTSVTKGFGISVSDTIGVVDKLSAVDMVSATNAGGLAQALAGVANSAKLAGVDINKLAGYAAVIGETTGESMDSVGTSLNAMFSRMGNIKLARLADYQNDGESLNNVETVLNGLNIKLRDSQSQFRNFGNVLDEVGGNWNSYNSVQQHAIAASIAGVNHMNDFLTLMSGYKTALGYASIATNSSGTAMQKFSIYEESVEAKSKKLTASLEGLSSAFLDSGLVKGTLDVGSGLFGGLTKLIDTLGTIPTLAGIASVALSTMGKQQIFGNQNGSFSFLGKTVEEMRQATAEGQKFGGLFTKQVVQPFANAESVINKYNLGLKNNSLTQKGFQRLLEQSDESLGGYLTGLKGAPADVSKYTTSLNTSKVSTVGLTVATTAMNMAMTMGIAALVTLAVTGISKLITYQQDCINKANELTSTYKEQQKTITDNISTIQGLDGEFTKLSKGVGEYGNNIALSADEYKRYQEIVSQILGISPQLTTGYNAEGDAITKKNDLIERSIALLKEEQKQKLADITTDDKLKEIGKGKKEETKKANDKIQSTGKDAMDVGLKLVQEVSADSASKDSNSYSQLMQNYNNIFVGKDLNERNKALENFKSNLKTLNVDGGKNLTDFISKVQSYNRANIQAEQTSEGFAVSLQNVAQATDNYDTLTDAQKNFTTNYINQFKLTGTETDQDFIDMGNKVRDFVDTIVNASDESKANINNLFALDKSKMSAGEYKKQADVLIDVIAKEFEMNPIDLKVQLGMDSVDTLIDEAKKKVNTADVNSAYTSQEATDKSSFVEGLSEDDLKILVKLDNVGSMSMEDLKKAIDEAKKSAGGLSIVEENARTLKDVFASLSDNVSIFSTAQKEMADSGTLSSGTLSKLMELFPNYLDFITMENGKIILNTDAYKKLATAEIEETIAKKQNERGDLARQLEEEYQSVKQVGDAHYANAIAIQAEIAAKDGEINQSNLLLQASKNELNTTAPTTTKKSDPNQDAYEKAMANHIHLHNMQLESDTDFYNAMEQANETYYKNDVDHLKDYNTNIETIYNGRNDIIKQAFEDEKTILQDANSGSIADEKKYLETLSKLNDEYYKGKTQFGKEYIATQKEIAKGQADLIKQENESQIDYISSQKDKFDKAADDKINALKKQNDEVDKQLEKQQHLLDLQEKEIALKHAEENSRMVVGDNGIEYRTNPDDIKNAELDVAKAKQAIEQDKTDEQISALEDAKATGDDIYNILLEMYKALTGKDITPTKSDPEVEARLAQAITVDKDGTILVNGIPITPSSSIKDTIGNTKLDLSGFNHGNLNMNNLLNDSLNGLNNLGAVTNNNSTKSQTILCDFNGANFNLPNVQDGSSFERELIKLLPNATAQINGKQ